MESIKLQNLKGCSCWSSFTRLSFQGLPGEHSVWLLLCWEYLKALERCKSSASLRSWVWLLNFFSKDCWQPGIKPRYNACRGFWLVKDLTSWSHAYSKVCISPKGQLTSRGSIFAAGSSAPRTDSQSVKMLSLNWVGERSGSCATSFGALKRRRGKRKTICDMVFGRRSKTQTQWPGNHTVLQNCP